MNLLKREILYDQPIKDNKKARVTGPFTVEAVPSQFVQNIGKDNANVSFKYEWLEEVKRNGIKGKKSIATDMNFVRLEKISGFKYLHAEGGNSESKKCCYFFWPRTCSTR